jgi:drug/metabolite transporter (DMT)-like permease
MLTLIASILCSVAVSILLKVARQRQIDVAQAIVVNYGVAVTLSLVLLQPHPSSLLNPSTPWWILIALGVLLPSVFLFMAAAVRQAGIVLSDAAQRLSLFLPLLAAFLLFGEHLGGQKLLGIGLALTALLCLLIRPHQTSQQDIRP